MRTYRGSHRSLGAAFVGASLLVVRASAAQVTTGEQEVTVEGSSAGSFSARASTDASPRPLADAATLLEEVPSVHLRRLGGEGSFASVSVRGSASTGVGAFLGSIPLTSAADPSVDAGALPLWPGATFRVHRGFAPAALGTTGYLGGVIAIEPPSPDEGSRTETALLAGSFGSLKARVGDVRRIGDVAVGTGVFLSRSDGDFPYDLTDPVTGRRETRLRQNGGYASAGAIARASLERRWGEIGATLLAQARREGLPGAADTPTTVTSLATNRLVAGVDGRARTGAAGAWHGVVWVRREESDFRDPLGELDPARRPSAADDRIEAAGASVGWRGHPLERLLLDVFVDGRSERFVPDEAIARGAPAQRFAGGIGTDAEWSPVGPVTLAASGRLDVRHDQVTQAAATGGAPSSASDVAPTGHIGVSWRVAPALVASVHGGALARPPSFLELYGNRGTLVGDPSLRPERALSADAGVRGSAQHQGVQFRYEIVGFATEARDLIAFVAFGRGTFRAQNIDQSALGGVEASAELRARHVATSIRYTFLATENRTDDPIARGRPLPGRPEHDLGYDAIYRIGPVGLRYGLDAIAGTTVDVAGTIVLPPRIFHGIGASLDVPYTEPARVGAHPAGGGLRLALDVENLFDVREAYVRSALTARSIAMPVSDFLGFPLPGRTVWLTLRYLCPG